MEKEGRKLRFTFSSREKREVKERNAYDRPLLHVGRTLEHDVAFVPTGRSRSPSLRLVARSVILRHLR